ncbi:MAG: hypothetical protein AAGJ18_22415 [Bacteroidota bacterium]
MQDSRLLEIFQQLTKKEIRALGKFVHSPYHNQRKDVIALFDYLRLTDWTNNPELSTRKKAFQYVFPNQPFKEKQIRYTISFLFQIIKEFLAIQHFKSNTTNVQIATIQSFRQKGSERLFQQQWKNTAQLLEKSPLRNQTYFYQKYLLESERYQFTVGRSRGRTDGLLEAADHLDQFFMIDKLRQSARSLSYKTLGSDSFQPKFLQEILAFVNQKNIENDNKMMFQNPATAIYYHCYQILAAEDSLSYFQQLRQLIAQHSTCFTAAELQDIYSFALNYCIKQLNAQNLAFGQEALELYQEGLRQEIFFENGHLSRFNYKNIVALGLGLKEFNWVAQFIETYQPFLDKKYRESAYNYNLALLYYRTEKYDQAMTLLQKVGTKDVLNNLTARRMLVTIYYDRGDFEPLYSLLDSFQNYIYRKSGLDYQRRMYLNFIKFTRKLLKIKRMSVTQIRDLQSEIEQTKHLVEKEWLLNKLSSTH